MSGWQVAFIVGLFALPPATIGYWAGWVNGRRCLRADLRARRRVAQAAEPPTAPLPVAGRWYYPPEPALLWSEQRAAADECERTIRRMTVAAEERIPGRWRR